MTELKLVANSILYIGVNFAGMYARYLTDRSQRKAFLETHRSVETRYRTQKENDRQEKLLLSGSFRFSIAEASLCPFKSGFLPINWPLQLLLLCNYCLGSITRGPTSGCLSIIFTFVQ